MKEQMPKRGRNYVNPQPEVQPCLNKKQDGLSTTYGKGPDGYNRKEFRELKKRLRNYRGNSSRKNEENYTGKKKYRPGVEYGGLVGGKQTIR